MQTVFFVSIHLAGKPLPAMDRQQTTSIFYRSYFVFRSHFPVSPPVRRSLQVPSQLETLLVPIRFLFRILFLDCLTPFPPSRPLQIVCLQRFFSLCVFAERYRKIPKEKHATTKELCYLFPPCSKVQRVFSRKRRRIIVD